MTWSEKVILHISRSVWSSWTHLWCFHCYSWSLSKVISEKLPVTFHDLKWLLRHGKGSLVTIFLLRASNLPVVQCLRVLRMIFFQKRRLSFFSHWLPNREVAKLTWPWVFINIPRYTFYRYWYGYQSLNVSRWSVIRCSSDEHSNLFWGEVTWRDLVTWPWVTWVRNFHKVCGKDVWTAVPKTVALRAAVFQLSAKNLKGGCSNTPRPGAG